VRGNQLISRACEIGDQPSLLIVDDGTDRNKNHSIRAAGSVLSLSSAVFAALGLDVRVIPHFEKGPYGLIGAQDDAPAVTAVSPIGTALGLVRLAMKRDRTVSARSRENRDPCLIDERHTGLDFTRGKGLATR
jgi:hypothetical protein